MTNREGTPSSLSKGSSSTVEQKLYLTLYKLSKLSCSKIFLDPVPTSDYPDYSQVIKTPMDISTIIEKLKQSKYRYISEVYNDLMLICKNSFSYHRGRQSQKRMKEAVAKFVKSIDYAWNLLRKNIEELNKRQEAELIRGDELRKLISNIELMMKKSYQKKIEKLTSFKVVIKEETNGIAAMLKDKTNKHNSGNMKSQSQDQQNKKKEGMPLQPYQRNNQSVSGKTGQNNYENKASSKSKTQSYYRQQSQQISETDQLPYQPRQENTLAADKQKEELHQENRKQAIGENEESVTLSLNRKFDSNKKNYHKQQEILGKNPSDIDAGPICQDFNKLVKQKLKKYKALLLHYLNWIQNNIFEVQPINKCDEHLQQQQKSKSNEITINQEHEEASQILCYDCIQYEKERDMYNQLKDMLTFRYLYMFLAREKREVEKGQINLKRLLKFLKELNLWLKLLTSPYINWRSKQEFVQIERNLIKCFEKIIQYKKLGPQFSNQINKIKNENKEGENQNDSKIIGKQGVRTRSKKRVTNQSHSQPDFIRKYQLNKRKQVKQLNLTNRYSIVDTLLDMKEGQENQNEIVKSKDEQYQQFLSLIEQDQIYNSFKVVIVRDKEDPHTLIVKNKKQEIKRRIINRKKRQKKMKRSLKDRAQSNKQEDSILQQTDQDEYQPPIKQRLIKHRNKRKCSIRQQIDEQHLRKQIIQQQKKEDEELINNYSLRSNSLVIEKYRQRLQLDWNKKWQEIFGAVPDKIEFQNVTAEQSQIIQF